MNPARERALREVMAADFTLVDMQLYLDTHPWDQMAIKIQNQNVQRAKMLRENFERLYGPLTPYFSSKCPYEWIESPWPWEREVTR